MQVSGLAGTGIMAARDGQQYRAVADIAGDGLKFDAMGYPMMALWLATFLQRFEAAFPEAAARPLAPFTTGR